MTRILTIGAAFLLVFGAAAHAQEEGDVAKRVAGLIKKLGSEDFQERENATEELRKIGDPAVPQLKKAMEEAEDPEVRARAESIVDEIEAAKEAEEEKKNPTRDRGRGFGGGGGFSFRSQSSGGGGSFMTQSDGTGTTYDMRPAGKDPIKFFLGNDGSVELEYRDKDGKKKKAKAKSVKKFIEKHPELAKKYGITKDGIDYGQQQKFGGGGGVPDVQRMLRGVPGFGRNPQGTEDPPDDVVKELDDLLRKVERENKDFDDLYRWRTRAPEATFGAVPEAVRVHLAIPEGQGIAVERVPEGSAAAALGLREHDIILEIDGAPVRSAGDARSLTERSTVAILRDGKRLTLGARD
ncbi:MAG: PDZ domain-containing protein [Planctomycetota bacterium]